jgi:hypothetical protein
MREAKKKKEKKGKQSNVPFPAKNHINRKNLLTGPSASMDQKGLKMLSEKEGKKKKRKKRNKKKKKGKKSPVCTGPT